MSNKRWWWWWELSWINSKKFLCFFLSISRSILDLLNQLFIHVKIVEWDWGDLRIEDWGWNARRRLEQVEKNKCYFWRATSVIKFFVKFLLNIFRMNFWSCWTVKDEMERREENLVSIFPSFDFVVVALFSVDSIT